MKSSRGEIKICDILDEAGLAYKEEYAVKNLVATSGRVLRFDFCVFDDYGDIDFFIEYQGEQHYEPVSKYGGKTALKRQKYNDAQKRKYCSDHHIPLVIVPYWDYNKLNYDYIINAAYGNS